MKRSNFLVILVLSLIMGIFIQVSRAQVNQIEIYSPRQGWVVDWHCQQLTWEVVPTPAILYVKISIDGGETWQDLKFHDPAGTVPKPPDTVWNDGHVTYEPPHVWTKQAIIRLISFIDPDDYCESRTFAVRHPLPESLVVTHPQPGDSFVAGTAVDIRWHSNHYESFEYDIKLSTDGQQTWSMICKQANNDGYYYWRIPSDIESDNCYIRLYSDLYGWGYTDTTGPFTITQNMQQTHFEDVSVATGLELSGRYRCVSWIDLNQDGYLDLFISGTDGYPNLSYLNNGDGTFVKGSLQADVEDTDGYNRAAVFGDINNDGYPDLYLGGGNGHYDKLFLNNGDSTFENITSQAGIGAFSQETNGVSFLDYNLDGNLDIYVCKWGMHNLLYRNEGNATFTEVSSIAGVGGESGAGTSAVAVGDYNRDRYPDLYVVNSGNEGNILYNNNGDDTFSNVTNWLIGLEWSNSKTAEWGDFNNDGLLDLYVVRRYSSNKLFQYNNNGLFTDITDQCQLGDTGEGVVTSVGDLDGDGSQDICIGNRGSNGTGELLFYLQNGEGAFNEQGSFSGLVPLDEPRGMALGDYDNDGDLDLFVVNYNGPSKLFENKYMDISQNHFFKVKLEGVMSNKDAIGTRVLILYGDNRQVREVQVGKGYGDGNSLEVEFGLGSYDFVDNMMVFWPSGIVQSFSDLFADSLYSIREIPGSDPEENPDVLMVIQPIEGANFQSGTIESISWETAGDIEQVLLEYSTDGGKNFQSIATAENSGLFDWSIPHNVASDSCCIRIADAEDGSPADTSGLFQLEIPTIPFYWNVNVLEQKAGDSFWVTLNLGNEGEQVYSMMNLSGGGQFFDPVYVNMVTDSFVLGSMWGDNPWIDVEIDTSSGQFSFSLQRSIGEGGFHGFGEVARILFESKFNTPDSLDMVVQLDSLSLRDTEWTDIPIHVDTLAISILNEGLIVWPGDADNNGIVNQKDVLPLGLYWEAEGPMRNGLSLDWIGQKCVPWLPDDVTYSDGNGDGQINMDDLAPVQQNWGQQHGNGDSVFPLGQQASVGQIYLQVAEHEPYAPFTTDILINGEANLYGMALNFCYYKEKIEIDSVEIGSSWGDEALFLYSDNADTGEVGIGISLKAVQPGPGQSVDGILARVWMRVRQDVPLNQPVIFRIEDLLAVNASGECLMVTTENDGFVTDVNEALTEKPLTFQLYTNYPNPFNPSTVISYDIPRNVSVLLKIYDVLGHEVRTLVNQEQKSGNYAIEWDGRDNAGSMVSSGIYIYKIVAGDHVSTMKCMLMK